MTVTAMPPGATQGGAKGATDAPEEEGTSGKRGRKRKLLIVLALLIALGGGGGWFLLKPSGPAEPVPGEVLSLEPVQLNLAGGHYLRVGVALQLVEGAHEVDGSKALDATIATFSGLEVAEVTRPQQRQRLKAELMDHLEEDYHGDVMEVYFTEFVTQ